MTKPSRAQLLALSDAELLQLCRTDTFRSTGPGGQHRNRNDTAVRLTLNNHPDIRVEADESRSQHRNRHQAVRRLRLEIALQMRTDAPPEWTGSWQLNPKNPQYPKLVAKVFDALDQNDYRIADAARALNRSTGQLNRLLQRHSTLWGHVQQERQRRGLKPLRQ